MVYTEKGAVERFIIEELKKLGWEYKPADELERPSIDEPLLLDRLRSALLKINKDKLRSRDDADKIVEKIKSIRSGIKDNKSFLDMLRSGVSWQPSPHEKAKTIWLIDFENPDNNDFLVTNQYTVREGENRIRCDIVLFVNGIPLVVIEAKSPVKAGKEGAFEEAFRQVKRYEKEVPKLFKYNQFSIVTDGISFTKYGATYTDVKSFFEWKDAYPLKLETDDLLKLTIHGMLSKRNLLDLVENFIFFRTRRGKLEKIIAWYNQFRAANKIVERVVRTLKGEDNKRTGLIWHIQGSGKTETMMFAAWKLQRHDILENPTIFIVVDRDDLERQVSDFFTSYSVQLRKAETIEDLIDLIAKDTRGIVVTLIQKFRESKFEEARRKYGEIVMKRKNIVVFTDESHRSQYGILAIQMRSVFPNAFFFGFTGTPIAKGERDTFRTFCPKGETYLDKYFMKQSIRDGLTVPIHYLGRLPEYHLKKEELDIAFEAEFAELSREEKERIKRKAARVKTILKDPERVSKIANDVAEHFRKYVEPLGFKALLATPDREACAMYKSELDKHLPPEFSAVIFSQDPNDPELLLQHHKSEDEERRILRESFQERDKNPKILIVTDKLLTGFDAPINLVLYLDKPLRDHRLLQAIGRTNRPYENKEFGLVVDYAGVFEDLTRVLDFYEEDIEGVAYDYDILRQRFREVMKALLATFEGVKREDSRDSLLEAIDGRLSSEEKRLEFERGYRRLRDLFEFLSPDPFLKDYLNDYRWLTQVYIAYRRKCRREDPAEFKEYYKKTVKMIQESVDLERIRKDIPIIEIDERCLDKAERAYPELASRVSELVFATERFITVYKTKSPVYEKLSKKVERVLEKVKRNLEKLENLEKSEEELRAVVKEISEIRREPEKMGITPEEYTIMKVLGDYIKAKSQELIVHVRKLEDCLRSGRIFPGWLKKEDAQKSVFQAIRLYVLNLWKKYGLSAEQRDRLYSDLCDHVKECFSDGL